jgi:hypothetical protein
MMVRCTRSTAEEYKEIGMTAKQICRKKKREYEKRKLETLEKYGAKGETRKFYKEVRQRKTSFQPRVDFCRDKEGNMIKGEVEIRDRWKEYFEELLNMKGTRREDEEQKLERYATDKEGNLIEGEVEIRDRWKEYFEELLNMKGTGSEGEEERLERYTNVEPE